MDDAAGPRYAWLRRALRARGFDPIPVPIVWKRRVMSDYIEDFLRCFREHAPRRAYVLGFSYGSIVALCTANEVAPERLFLCSLTSEFQEDISAMKPWIQRLVGKRRLENARTRSAKRIACALRTPLTIFYGTQEARQYPQLKIRCEETAKLAADTRLVVIPNCPHRIDHPAYRKAITRELDREVASRN